MQHIKRYLVILRGFELNERKCRCAWLIFFCELNDRGENEQLENAHLLLQAIRNYFRQQQWNKRKIAQLIPTIHKRITRIQCQFCSPAKWSWAIYIVVEIVLDHLKIKYAKFSCGECVENLSSTHNRPLPKS